MLGSGSDGGNDKDELRAVNHSYNGVLWGERRRTGTTEKAYGNATERQFSDNSVFLFLSFFFFDALFATSTTNKSGQKRNRGRLDTALLRLHHNLVFPISSVS